MSKTISTPTKYFNPYTNLAFRQYEAYLKNLVEYSEVQNVSDTAFGDGELAKARKIAKGMLAKGFDLKIISELTDLSEAEIEML